MQACARAVGSLEEAHQESEESASSSSSTDSSCSGIRERRDQKGRDRPERGGGAVRCGRGALKWEMDKHEMKPGYSSWTMDNNEL